MLLMVVCPAWASAAAHHDLPGLVQVCQRPMIVAHRLVVATCCCTCCVHNVLLTVGVYWGTMPTALPVTWHWYLYTTGDAGMQ